MKTVKKKQKPILLKFLCQTSLLSSAVFIDSASGMFQIWKASEKTSHLKSK